jgi:hypothetical protein
VRIHQDVGGLVAVGFGQHRYSLPTFAADPARRRLGKQFRATPITGSL